VCLRGDLWFSVRDVILQAVLYVSSFRITSRMAHQALILGVRVEYFVELMVQGGGDMITEGFPAEEAEMSVSRELR
jgi:hypothetical protein